MGAWSLRCEQARGGKREETLGFYLIWSPGSLMRNDRRPPGHTRFKKEGHAESGRGKHFNDSTVVKYRCRQEIRETVHAKRTEPRPDH